MARGPWGHFTHRPAPVCSACGKMLDAWFALEPGTRPQPSAPGQRQISICIECGALHEFVGPPKRLQLKRLEGDELILALANPTVKKARGLILMDRALRERRCTR
jgi:hypothetical protein